MTTVYFSPVGNGQTFFNTQGQILAGGKIYTYSAGTTTPLATYTDNTGTVQNANPIILNSAGQVSTGIWLSATTKFVIQDSLGNTIQTVDNIVGINNIAISIVNDWVQSGMTPTYISDTQFSVAGDQSLILTKNRRIKFTITAGTVYGSITNVSVAGGVTTLTMLMDSGTLDNGLSAFSYGFEDPSHPSVQINNVALTGTVGIGGGTAISSAATLDLTSISGSVVHVTGTTATSALTMNKGQIVVCIADGAWPLTYNATTNNINTNSSNVTLAAGDMVLYSKDVGGVIRGVIHKHDGTSPSFSGGVTPIANGGTGATTQAGALSALGLRPINATWKSLLGSSAGSGSSGVARGAGTTLTNGYTYPIQFSITVTSSPSNNYITVQGVIVANISTSSGISPYTLGPVEVPAGATYSVTTATGGGPASWLELS